MTDLDAFESLMAEIEGKPPKAESSGAKDEPEVSVDTTGPEEPVSTPDGARTAEISEDHKKDPRTVRTAVAGVLGFMHADLGRGAPADGGDWREAYETAAKTLADAIGWTQQPENREF
jgi:hypothetical protein